MAESNDITSNHLTSEADMIEIQNDNLLFKEDNDDDYYSRSKLHEIKIKRETLLMLWLTRKDWIESIEMIKKIKSNATMEVDFTMSFISGVFSKMIKLLHRCPETFIQYMKQSNDENQNWDAIILLTEQLSSIENFNTDTDISIIDHQSLSEFLSETIISTRDGETLLHWFCSHRGIPITVIEILLRQLSTSYDITKMILKRDTFFRGHCLHLVCSSSCKFSAAKLLLLLSYMSDQDAQKVMLKLNVFDHTVLHVAMMNDAVFDVIRTIVSIQPKTLQFSPKGVYPVHELFRSFRDEIPGKMAIKQLLNDDGDDNEYFARPSLDTFDISWNKENSELQLFWEKVEYLAIQSFTRSDACPTHLSNWSLEGGINEKDEKHNERRKYILHGLLQCDVPIKLFKLCLCLYPISATAIDRHGNTPLHILVQNESLLHGCLNEIYESIQMCITTYPTATGITNDQQFIPLHCAILTLSTRNKYYTTDFSYGVYDLLLTAAPNRSEERRVGKECRP